MGRFDRLKAFFKDSFEQARENMKEQKPKASHKRSSDYTRKESGFTVTCCNEDRSVMAASQLREIEKRREQQQREYETIQTGLKSAYSKMGVAVSLVSDEAIASDAREIANGLCKARVRIDSIPSRIVVNWRPLAKSGKVPKCVLKTSAVWDKANGDSVIVHVSYLSDIEPYSADVHIWKDGQQHSYKIRVKDGTLRIVD